MKTIFIPIATRPQARNVLRTDILKTLATAPNVRVVVFAPPLPSEEYRKEFSHLSNVIFESVPALPRFFSRADAFWGRVSLFYINSPTGKFLRKQWLLYERKSPLRFFFSRTLLSVIGNIRPLRSACRWLDYHTVKDNRFDTYFKHYKPELVFVPRVDASLDRSLLRHAKKRNIKTVGMISAWDNITLSKYPFRILPDKLVAYNTLIEKDATKYIDMPKHDIFVSGWPHFDFYLTSQRCSRKSFCDKLGIDTKKRIVLFASIGSKLNPTEPQVLASLERALEDGTLPSDTVVIFRKHPTEKSEGDSSEKHNSNLVIIDDSKTMFQKKGFSEILTNDMNHLADSLYHADVTVNTASTMSIDASAFDTPVINIAFDGNKKKKFHESVRRFYEPTHDHYQSIVKSGGVALARSFDELVGMIHTYLENPTLHQEGRKRIIQEQCYTFDGHSGERIAHYVLKRLN